MVGSTLGTWPAPFAPKAGTCQTAPTSNNLFQQRAAQKSQAIAGYRLAGNNATGGKFDGIGGYAHLWTATETPDGLAHYLLLDFSTKAAKISAFGKDEARSVRCVK